MIEPVVNISWWEEHRNDVVTADVRWYLDGRSGVEAYTAGHIPGSVFIDLDEWLSDHSDPTRGRHPMPSAELFAEGMSENGISNDSTVVAYDDAGGVIAARLVWMLRVTGHNAALLDGGLLAYRGPLESGMRTRPRANFEVRPWPPERFASLSDAMDPKNIVLDARNRDRYRGEPDPVDPRSGHIPGALNVPCRENLAEGGLLRPIHELRRTFLDVGVVDANQVVSYCGSGVTACHNLLTLEFSGFGLGRLYPGSWSQYSNLSDLPIATGEEPG